ncbi:MAG: replication-associated recombination protein A [Ignavibacteriales bacterium]
MSLLEAAKGGQGALESAGGTVDRGAPLARRMRPTSLDEFVGQEDIVGPGRLLRRAIEEDTVPSMILWGPAGTGKTTLAAVIARTTKARFVQLSAVTSGVADLKKAIEEAKSRRDYGEKTILFVDEVHRFNKAQQDALLPGVEDGAVTLIGATTENPYFELNSALVSRTRIFRLSALTEEQTKQILRRAMADPDRGLGRFRVRMDDDALAHIVTVANGDARSALNALETAVLTTPPEPDGSVHVTIQAAVDATQKRAVTYDRAGDQHYDHASAFIKSMRGSDPDAALYWMAKMIYAGETPTFIARRILICAAEDVGMADPQAIVVASSAAYAADFVGFPEARIPLAQAAVYVATAPKSNAVYAGINAALDDVEHVRTAPVPIHLRDSSYAGASKLGHGKGYKYAHDYPGNFVPQQYLPKELAGRKYYVPSGNGFERAVAERMARLRGGGGREPGNGSPGSPTGGAAGAAARGAAGGAARGAAGGAARGGAAGSAAGGASGSQGGAPAGGQRK